MATDTNGTAAPELPKTFKAAVYDEPGKISTKVVDLDMPEPGPGEVLINLYVQLQIR
jgi:propanol-preferring alcohol dehydrogenase